MAQIIHLIDSNTRENVNYEEISVWYDGTPITDGKVDNYVYRKKGNEYYRNTSVTKSIKTSSLGGSIKDCISIVKKIDIINTIIIDSIIDLNGEAILLPPDCIINFQGGKLTNGLITGDGNQVICSQDVIFEKILFSGRFKDSTMTLTNFGLIDDMVTIDDMFTYKGMNIPIKRYSGTIAPIPAIKMISSFCSGSENVTLTINGSFFCGKDTILDNILRITDAKRLRIQGGKTQLGIYLTRCEFCEINNIQFVGFHDIHDWPKACTNAANIADDVFHFSEGIANIGLSVEGVYIRSINEDKIASNNIEVRNCTFQMRMNGVVLGNTALDNPVHDLIVQNCTASHIWFQPYATHCKRANIINCRGNYCYQGLDVSTGSSDITVNNLIVTKEFYGSKIESSENAYDHSYNIKIFNSSFEIVTSNRVDDSSQVLFTIANGREGDECLLDNCTFVYNSTLTCSGLVFRRNLILRNSTIDVKTAESSRLFFGYNNNNLSLRVTNCDISIVRATLAMSTGVHDMAFSKTRIQTTSDDFSQHFYSYRSIFFDNCELDIKTSRIFEASAGGIIAELKNSTIKSATYIMYSNNNTQSSIMKLHNNHISCDKIVNAAGGLFDYEITNNILTMTGDFAIDIRTTHEESKVNIINNVIEVDKTTVIRTTETNSNINVSDNTFINKGVSSIILITPQKNVQFVKNNKLVGRFTNANRFSSLLNIPVSDSDGNMIFENNKPFFEIEGKRYDSSGNEFGYMNSGTTAQRPVGVVAGFFYFDSTLVKPVWWTGARWVDANGATV